MGVAQILHEVTPPNMAVRVALVGCGRISRVHLNSLLSLRDPSLVISSAIDPNVTAAEQTRQLLPAPQECKVLTESTQI